jgi:hypothetical protein
MDYNNKIIVFPLTKKNHLNLTLEIKRSFYKVNLLFLFIQGQHFLFEFFITIKLLYYLYKLKKIDLRSRGFIGILFYYKQCNYSISLTINFF